MQQRECDVVWPGRDRAEPGGCAASKRPPGLKADQTHDTLRLVIESSVGQVFGVFAADFGSVTRGPARVALARQVAMYLCHVACRRTLTDVGRIFARDRTTVAHACGVVEDCRDDPRFDRVLDLLETIVRFKLEPRTHAGHAEWSGR